MEDTEVQEEVQEDVQEEEETAAEDAATEDVADGDDAGDDDESRDAKTWYPYITKAQFEKFLSRLQSKVPDEVDRDYIRAIIRTPSMIYRFLRGIEAMKLIDRDQRPTDRLGNLVNESSRQKTISEILEDLYPELLTQYRASGSMVDREVVTFFRRETGMGNDSANKMKMFFKYLLSESDLDGAAAAATEDDEEEQAEAPPERRPTQQRAARPARQQQSETTSSRPERTSERTSERGERGERTSERTSERGERTSERGERTSERTSERGERGDRGERSERGDRGERGAPPSRTLSETQRAYLDTLKSVLSINIDGDWDDDMMKLAFDRLERLYDRVRRG